MSAAATIGTVFFFPFHQFTPPIAVGITSLFVVAVAILARYILHLASACECE